SDGEPRIPGPSRTADLPAQATPPRGWSAPTPRPRRTMGRGVRRRRSGSAPSRARCGVGWRVWSPPRSRERGPRTPQVTRRLRARRAQWTQESAVDLKCNDMMRVSTNPAEQLLTEYRVVVRNSVGASDNWHRTILCDVTLGGRFSG